MNQAALNLAVERLIRKHGSLRAASRAIKVDHAYLYRLAAGKKTQPSEAILTKLGLNKETTYKEKPKEAFKSLSEGAK